MKKPVFVIVLVTLFAIPAISQTPYFQHYFLLKKNEPVQINTIFQDQAGFVWFGTNKGLFQYNGKKYRRLTVADSLADDQVTAIAQDSSGRIWTGHGNGCISVVEKNVVSKFETSEGSATAEVSDILFDRRGNLWFSTLNDGLYYFTNNRLHRLDEAEGMPDLFVYDILEDGKGNIWAGTDGGVAVCTLKGGKVSINVLNYADGLPDNIVKKLAVTADNTVWMATEDAGVIGYDPVSSKFKTLLNEPWYYGSISDFILKDDKFWIASPESGLLVYDHKNGKTSHYSTRLYGLSPLYTLLKDKEGNIWAGSKTGVARTPGDHLEFIESLAPATSKVIALSSDKKGCVWFSAGGGLFKRCVDRTGAHTIERQLSGTPFQRYTVISLFTDEAGYLWAGLYGEGALRINPTTGTIKHINKELRNGNVLSVTGKGNIVWLATLGGSEQITVSGEKLSIKNYSTGNGLSSDFIYQIFLDSKNRVWFATDGKGVDMMDDTGFHHLEAGLNSKVVYGFAEDSDGDIWINVQGNGLYKFNGDEFQPIDARARLRDNNINCFATDASGNIILMHDLGIDIYNIKTGKVRYLGEEAGIRNKKATLNALASDRYDNLLIGTDGGIIQFTPHKGITDNDPEVTIDGLRIFDQKVNMNDALDFRYDENSVAIDFYGFWYQDPESLNFLYKMDNYDTDWITTGDNAVTYSRLPPGDYTFRVKVSDTEDFTHAKEASIAFTISPPFWRTGIFYVLAAMVVVLLAYAFIMYREKSLRDDKIELEAKVEERTREIQRKTEEIQAQNEEIMAQAEEIKGINENLEMLVNQRTWELEKKNQALEEYAFINAHKLRSPVASILGLIHLMSKTKLTEEAREVNDHMQQAADELDSVVRTITEAIERGEKLG